MDTMTLKYHARKRPKFYYKQDAEPQPSIIEHWIDIFAKRFTTWLNKKTNGRTAVMGWGNCMLRSHVCPVCGGQFWTEREDEDVCDSRECFIKRYGNEENKADQQAHI